MKKLSAKKLKIIAVAVIILIIASAAALAVKSHSSKSDNQTLSREATVTRGNIDQGLSETGSASVNTVYTQLDIDLEIDDAKLDLDVVIDDVYVRAGERVTKGQPLFSIDQNSLNTARNTLENEYTSAKLKLEQAKIQQQKGTIEAKSTMDTDKSSGKLAEQIYQNSVTSIDNTLASYKQKVLEDEEALQGYFMARMSKYVQSKGKEAMGWDELTNTRIPDGAIIYGWRGYGQAAVKAAEQGHRFVMTPARIMYLIRYQGPQWFEPLTYFGNNTLKDVYRYEPIQKEWSPEVRSLLMGVQASMWTEFCNKPEDVEYQLFPRLAALAEVAWTQPWHKNWRSFLVAMDKFNEHLSAKGIVFACSMYNIQHTVTPVNGKLQVKLECERPDVEIRYTMDGKEPTDRSPLYKNPLMVTGTQTIKCTTYRAGRQMGKTLTLPLVWNKATAKPVLGNTQAGKILVNGIRGSLRQSDFEWHSWESSDSVAFTIDLQKKESLRSVSVGCITNYGMAAHKPADIEVWVSNDNRDYRKVSGKQFTDGEIFREGTFKEDVVLDLNKEIGRYVRIIAKGAGECPATHVRPGQEARIYFDEVMIE